MTYYELRNDPDAIPYFIQHITERAAFGAAARLSARLGSPILVYKVTPQYERFIGEA